MLYKNLYTMGVLMRIIFIDIIVLSALVLVATACSSILKDISIQGSIDFEKDGMKEEMSIEGKL